MLSVGGFAAAVAAFSAFRRFRKRRYKRALAAIAEPLGLTLEEDGGEASGIVRGHHVSLIDVPPPTLMVRADLAEDFALFFEGLGAKWVKTMGGTDIQLGVPTADRILNVWGDPVDAIARLGSVGRELACRLVLDSVVVSEGSVQATLRAGEGRPEALRARLDALLELAEALSLRGQRPQEVLLARIVAQADDPGYRHAALLALIRGGYTQAEAAARAALEDPNGRVRWVAATYLGDESALRRLEDADGQLAIVEPSDGQGALAVADPAQGALSALPPRDA